MALRPRLAAGLPLSPLRADGHAVPLLDRNPVSYGMQARKGCYLASITEMFRLSRPMPKKNK